jgi:hypothetical protein
MQQVFDGPIPGQSLTKTPGAYKFEKPPQYVEEDKALEWVWSRLLTKEGVANVRVLLQGDVTVLEMAQTLLYAGIMDGRWTPDLAFMMLQEVTWMVEAIAKRMDVKDYKFKRPKPQYKKFIEEYANFLVAPEKEEKKAAEIIQGTVFTGIA